MPHFANGFPTGSVVDAERARPVETHIRMHPGDTFFRVGVDDLPAEAITGLVGGQVQFLREGSFDDVARHVRSPWRYTTQGRAAIPDYEDVPRSTSGISPRLHARG